MRNALGRTMEYCYDETGNVVEMKDYAGNVTKNTYDAYTIGALVNARYEITEKNYKKFSEEIERAANIAHIPLADLKQAMKR